MLKKLFKIDIFMCEFHFNFDILIFIAILWWLIHQPHDGSEEEELNL